MLRSKDLKNNLIRDDWIGGIFLWIVFKAWACLTVIIFVLIVGFSVYIYNFLFKLYLKIFLNKILKKILLISFFFFFSGSTSKANFTPDKVMHSNCFHSKLFWTPHCRLLKDKCKKLLFYLRYLGEFSIFIKVLDTKISSEIYLSSPTHRLLPAFRNCL